MKQLRERLTVRRLMVVVAYVAFALMIVVECDRPYRVRVEQLRAEAASLAAKARISRRPDEAAHHTQRAQVAALQLHLMTQARNSERTLPILVVTFPLLLILLSVVVRTWRRMKTVHPRVPEYTDQPASSDQ